MNLVHFCTADRRNRFNQLRAFLTRILKKKSFLILVAISSVMTILAVAGYAMASFEHGNNPPFPSGGGSAGKIGPTLLVILNGRPEFALAAIASWSVTCGAIFWRGSTRSSWMGKGFDEDVFHLFVEMRGAGTRLRLLQEIARGPKYRVELARSTGLDWKAIDRQVLLMERYGFIKITGLFGRTRVYGLTSNGEMLLNLLQEMRTHGDIVD